MSINKLSLALGVALLALTACSSDTFIHHNGNMPTEERIAELKRGMSESEVMRLLGAPSSVVSLDKNTWIYMSYDVKKVAFFKPEEIGRDILKIQFDNNGKVVAVKRLSKAHGTEVVLNEDKTETLGQDPGLLQKTFGTLGTYSPFMPSPGSSGM